MKPTNTNDNPGGAGEGMLSPTACRACRPKILAQISRTKAAIFTESRRASATPERLVRLALNEAEAAAWQTRYPHLVFPALAAEKVHAVAAWSEHQQSVRQASPVFALAE